MEQNNKAMDMLVEYVLEENVSMTAKIRELEQENKRLKEQNKVYFDIEAEWGKKLADLKKIIEPCVNRSEKGHPTTVSIYKDETIEELCKFLRIPYDTPSAN